MSSFTAHMVPPHRSALKIWRGEANVLATSRKATTTDSRFGVGRQRRRWGGSGAGGDRGGRSARGDVNLQIYARRCEALGGEDGARGGEVGMVSGLTQRGVCVEHMASLAR